MRVLGLSFYGIATALFAALSSAAAADDIFGSEDYAQIIDTLKGWGSARPFEYSEEVDSYSSLARVDGREFYFKIPARNGKAEPCTDQCNFAFSVCYSTFSKPTYEQLNSFNGKWWSRLTWTEEAGTCIDLWVKPNSEVASSQLDGYIEIWADELKEFYETFEK